MDQIQYLIQMARKAVTLQALADLADAEPNLKPAQKQEFQRLLRKRRTEIEQKMWDQERKAFGRR